MILVGTAVSNTTLSARDVLTPQGIPTAGDGCSWLFAHGDESPLDGETLCIGEDLCWAGPDSRRDFCCRRGVNSLGPGVEGT